MPNTVRFRAILVPCLALGALLLPPSAGAQRATRPAATSAGTVYDPTVYTNGARTNRAFKSLRWRLVGPFRGGRSVAVTGDPTRPLVFYFGAVNGGVWKTTNAGASWTNITDGVSDISSVGAITVAPSDPNVIWVGTGEGQPREDVTYGTGVYRSTDGGKSWTSLGLPDARQITAIRVDGKDPDRAWVASLGHAFGPNSERGVFRTTDGGATWKKVLFLNDSTGAADLSIDPTNPRILFASMWKFQRTPWGMDAGSGRSGLWKTTDGGDTWTELSFNPGMPRAMIGKIGVSVSAANPQRVYANIEAADSSGGIFRSDDGGATWQRTNSDQKFVIRPFYYTSVTADPTNADVVYVMNLQVHRSIDGGRTFGMVRVPHGDTHQMWVSPTDGNRLINANDGGATVSLDRGATWSSIHNQPTSQFYHVQVDTQFPYRIYGAQQDNSTVTIASRSDNGAITERDWWPVAGCENAHIAVDPRNHDVTYGGCYMGSLTRYDKRTGQARDISVWLRNYDGWAVKDVPQRFQWTFPVMLSRHDPQALYVTSQYVWRSRNEGQGWERISPDLTLHDPKTMQRSGGPVSGDMTGTEWYATIYAFNESPRQAGVFWAGSDDGLVHVSRDNGASWQNVTPPMMAPFTRVTEIEPSPHAAGTAYVSATRYQLDDYRPLFYKTTDFGRTWTVITDGIPVGAYSRSLREDPVRRGLLYAGTEVGVFVSFNDGARWEPLQLNLPRSAVRDLRVAGNDLVIATHGRSFWSLDDLSPLRQWADSVGGKAVHLFQPAPAIRFAGGGGRRGGNVGENPLVGAHVDFWLKDKPAAAVTLQFLEAGGAVVRTFTSEPARPDSGLHPAADSAAKLARAAQDADSLAYIPADSVVRARAGANRFVWNLRYPGAKTMPGAIVDDGAIEGPMAVPGRYMARLIVGKDTLSRAFEVVPDPRLKTTPAEYREQFVLAKRVADRLTALTEGVLRIQDIQAQLDQRAGQAAGSAFADRVKDQGKALRAKMEAVRAELYEVYTKADQATLNYPIKLYQMWVTLNGQVTDADTRPTDQQGAIFVDLSQKLDVQLNTQAALEANDLARFNALMKETGLPEVYAARKPVP
ncbi:MAG: glycosyl hydrolase [Gemmatimonadetes bacterium]|nr:glycosyl hydrolase [Gemmatimonadota bacterium]